MDNVWCLFLLSVDAFARAYNKTKKQTINFLSENS